MRLYNLKEALTEMKLHYELKGLLFTLRTDITAQKTSALTRTKKEG